jgi:hypothetical protein
MRVEDANTHVVEELQRALVNFPTFHSPHEGLAVLEEEVAELRRVVHENKKGTRGFENDTVRRRFTGEAVHCAAMALRCLVDLC